MAREKHERRGRPRVKVDPKRLNRLRAAGLSWSRVAQALGIGTTTAFNLGKLAGKVIRAGENPHGR